MLNIKPYILKEGGTTMKKEQEFTGVSIPKGDLQEALNNAIKQAVSQLQGGKNILIDWRLKKVQGEEGGVVGRSLSVTISAVKRG
jgi:hypothetical protein